MVTHSCSPIMTALALIFALLLGDKPVAYAADITGAWATDVRVCTKIFQRKGTVVRLTSRSDSYGAGFVIDGSSIRGKLANCKIKNRKVDGDVVYLVAACATDIMLSDIEIVLKFIDKDRISRVFPGLSELESPYYYRCPQ